MKEIRILIDHIDGELDDAEAYARLAVEFRDTAPELAGVFYALSGEEMKHMDALHAEVVRMISAYKKDHDALPEGMKAVYDYVHERFTDRAERVNVLRSMYAR